MKQCTRCNNTMENGAQFCPKCGGTSFQPVMDKPKLAKPQAQAQQPQGNGQPRRPSGQQRPNQPQQAQQQRPSQPQQAQQQRPNQPKQVQQRPNTNQQQNSVNVAPAVKLTKKQQQSKDLAMMNAMKQAQANGTEFNMAAFERDWIARNVPNKSNGNTAAAVVNEDVTFVQWLIALLISVIPIVGIVYSVSCMKNYSYSDTRRNFHKAFLVLYCAMFVISIILTLVVS